MGASGIYINTFLICVFFFPKLSLSRGKRNNLTGGWQVRRWQVDRVTGGGGLYLGVTDAIKVTRGKPARTVPVSDIRTRPKKTFVPSDIYIWNLDTPPFTNIYIYCHVDRDASLSVHILLLHHYKSDFAHISDLYSLVIGLYKSEIWAKNN